MAGLEGYFSIKGCVFHWSQAVFRKIQECSLQVAYNERGDAYNFLRQLMALPFLPEEKIHGASMDMFQKTEDERVISVLEYVENQWISIRVFSAKSWSVFMRSVRTNNDVEG
ncbi:hypothetical protein SNE40_011266 [Patella caerulea]|uniref:Uncharacterized protein n=1 Tax=Patella caerulea TaxID=87958 RepID=A0AAN8PP48_PATCE